MLAFSQYTANTAESLYSKHVVEVDFSDYPVRPRAKLSRENPLRAGSFSANAKMKQGRFKLLAHSDLHAIAAFREFQGGWGFTAMVRLSSRRLGYIDQIDFLNDVNNYNAYMRRLMRKWNDFIFDDQSGRSSFMHSWVSTMDISDEEGIVVSMLCSVPENAEPVFRHSTKRFWTSHLTNPLNGGLRLRFDIPLDYDHQKLVQANFFADLRNIILRRQLAMGVQSQDVGEIRLNAHVADNVNPKLVKFAQVSSDLGKPARIRAGFFGEHAEARAGDMARRILAVNFGI